MPQVTRRIPQSPVAAEEAPLNRCRVRHHDVTRRRPGSHEPLEEPPRISDMLQHMAKDHRARGKPLSPREWADIKINGVVGDRFERLGVYRSRWSRIGRGNREPRLVDERGKIARPAAHVDKARMPQMGDKARQLPLQQDRLQNVVEGAWPRPHRSTQIRLVVRREICRRRDGSQHRTARALDDRKDLASHDIRDGPPNNPLSRLPTDQTRRPAHVTVAASRRCSSASNRRIVCENPNEARTRWRST